MCNPSSTYETKRVMFDSQVVLFEWFPEALYRNNYPVIHKSKITEESLDPQVGKLRDCNLISGKVQYMYAKGVLALPVDLIPFQMQK